MSEKLPETRELTERKMEILCEALTVLQENEKRFAHMQGVEQSNRPPLTTPQNVLSSLNADSLKLRNVIINYTENISPEFIKQIRAKSRGILHTVFLEKPPQQANNPVQTNIHESAINPSQPYVVDFHGNKTTEKHIGAGDMFPENVKKIQITTTKGTILTAERYPKDGDKLQPNKRVGYYITNIAGTNQEKFKAGSYAPVYTGDRIVILEKEEVNTPKVETAPTIEPQVLGDGGDEQQTGNKLLALSPDEYAKLMSYYLKGEGRRLSTAETAKKFREMLGRGSGEKIKPLKKETQNKIVEMIEEYANNYKIDPVIFKTIAYIESKFDPYAISDSMCIGLFQTNRGATVGKEAKNLGGNINPFNVKNNIERAAQLFNSNKDSLRKILKISDDTLLNELTVVAHNVGTPVLIREFKKGGNSWRGLHGTKVLSHEKGYLALFNNAKSHVMENFK